MASFFGEALASSKPYRGGLPAERIVQGLYRWRNSPFLCLWRPPSRRHVLSSDDLEKRLAKLLKKAAHEGDREKLDLLLDEIRSLLAEPEQSKGPRPRRSKIPARITMPRLPSRCHTRSFGTDLFWGGSTQSELAHYI